MAKSSQRPAAKNDRLIGAGVLERVSWDDLRVFVVVARTLSIRKSATVLRTHPTTIFRRIERLEDALGLRLFNRMPEGLALTAEGEAILTVAQQMERASHLLRGHLDQDLTVRGEVRCSITEGLGTLWVLPHLAQFSRTHPSTIVDLRCSMQVADVLRMEADLAVQLVKPDRPDVKAIRLGRMHVYPFASRRYVDIYGLPKSLDEVKQHRFVDQQAAQLDSDAARRALNLPSVDGVIALRTNSSAAHLQAVDLGMGIGGLGTYIAVFAPHLIPLDIGVRHHVDIWMTFHPDARSVRRVSAFIDWVRTLFDPKRYPWFGDEFIHPRELAQQRKEHAMPLPSILRAPKPDSGS